ncbi:unnamed protein product [Malus baccata var. baccata]
MEAVGQISKPKRASNLDRMRERRGLILEQTITVSLRVLAYGASTNQVDEIVRMGKSTILKSISFYSNECLRKPTTIDLQRLLKNGEMQGFPGMIGSIDCMHWTWKKLSKCMARSLWRQKMSQKAQNDLNIIAQSPVFDEVLQGKAPKITYWVNGHKYK